MSSKLRNLIEKTVKSKMEQIDLDRETVKYIASENTPSNMIVELSETTSRMESNHLFIKEAEVLLAQKDEMMERKLAKLSETIVRDSLTDKNNHINEVKRELSLLYFSSIK